MDAAITDPLEAREADLGYRAVRVAAGLTLIQGVAGASLLVMWSSVPAAGGGLIALAFATASACLLRWASNESRRRLASFADPLTGEITIPGGRTPLPRRLRHAVPISLVITPLLLAGAWLTR